MSFYPPSSPGRSFEAALAPFLHDDGLPFADVLPAEQVRQACLAQGVHFGASDPRHDGAAIPEAPPFA